MLIFLVYLNQNPVPIYCNWHSFKPLNLYISYVVFFFLALIEETRLFILPIATFEIFLNSYKLVVGYEAYIGDLIGGEEEKTNFIGDSMHLVCFFWFVQWFLIYHFLKISLLSNTE